MLKTTASKLKAKLGQYMRAVRSGKEVLVTDRDQPVAKLIPFRKGETQEVLVLSHPKDPTALPLGKVRLRPIPYQGTQSLELLLEDRRR
ncbi:MAG: type II toxin-antitoxin system Phd/YefM family antitoxin [Myxococcaceae bacterium]